MDIKNAKSRLVCLAVLASLPFAACGQEEDLPSCMEAVEYACGLCTQGLFYDLCIQEGQRDVCGLDCDFPEFSEGDCGDFSAAPDGECMTDCLGGDIEGMLTRLARPISEFLCCQMDYLL